MNIALIAAQSLNHVIGNGPDIPWQAKGEQKLFKQITLGGSLIMGRKTFASIGRPLPGRETIVVTRQHDFSANGCHIASSLSAAIDTAASLQRPCFIAGGGEIYSQAVSQLIVNDIHLTTIQIEAEGDVFFPAFDQACYELVDEQHFSTNLDYVYQHFSRTK